MFDDTRIHSSFKWNKLNHFFNILFSSNRWKQVLDSEINKETKLVIVPNALRKWFNKNMYEQNRNKTKKKDENNNYLTVYFCKWLNCRTIDHLLLYIDRLISQLTENYFSFQNNFTVLYTRNMNDANLLLQLKWLFELNKIMFTKLFLQRKWCFVVFSLCYLF